MDVRVKYPQVTQNAILDALFQHHEAMKYQSYKRECDARWLHFVPLIVTIDRAMGGARGQAAHQRASEKAPAGVGERDRLGSWVDSYAFEVGDSAIRVICLRA